MKFQTIMENWRRFNSSDKKLNEQATVSWEEADKLLGVAAERELKPNEIEKLKTWLQSVPDDADDGTKSIVPDVVDVIRQQEIDKTFKSDSFNLNDIKKDEPELAKAIQVFRGKDITKSNLLFDGQKLHWRVGNQIIYSWAASSGKFEEDVLTGKQEGIAQRLAVKILAKAKVTRGPEGAVGDDQARRDAILGILGYRLDAIPEDAPFTAERLNEDILDLLKTVDEQAKIAETYRKLLKRIQYAQTSDDVKAGRAVIGSKFKADLRKIRKQYYALDRKIRSIIITYIEYAIGAGQNYETSPEQRRAKQEIEGKGPIPEGKYLVSHTMQDLTNMTNAEPFAQMLASVALMYTSQIEKTDIGQLAIRDQEAGRGNYAWGRFRVRISNIKGNDRTKNWEDIPAYQGQRGGFFIHGGSFRGSSGCIDLGDNMDSFAKFWTVGGTAKAMGKNVKLSFQRKKNKKIRVPKSKKYPDGIRVINSYWDGGGWVKGKINIPLFVQYKEIEKKKLVARNPIVKRFAKFIFDKLPAGVKDALKPAQQPVVKSPDLR